MFDFLKPKKKMPTAAELHQTARLDGQAGNFDAAISKLQEAIALEPGWAYPYYDLAYSYFLKGDSAKALEYYYKTDALEPKGFFTTKTAIHALEGEANGRFPKGTYCTYMQIEWFDSLPRKLETAKVLTEKVPQFAPGWKELANLLNTPAERLTALEKGLSYETDAETKGILELNRALLLYARGEQAAAKSIVEAILAAPDSTRSSLAIAKQVMDSWG